MIPIYRAAGAARLCTSRIYNTFHMTGIASPLIHTGPRKISQLERGRFRCLVSYPRKVGGRQKWPDRRRLLIFPLERLEQISVAYQDRMAGAMKIKVVKIDDRTFGVAINGEVFKVNAGCSMLGEAGSLMRLLKSKIMEAAAKARRARELRQPIDRGERKRQGRGHYQAISPRPLR